MSVSRTTLNTKQMFWVSTATVQWVNTWFLVLFLKWLGKQNSKRPNLFFCKNFAFRNDFASSSSKPPAEGVRLISGGNSYLHNLERERWDLSDESSQQIYPSYSWRGWKWYWRTSGYYRFLPTKAAIPSFCSVGARVERTQWGREEIAMDVPYHGIFFS